MMWYEFIFISIIIIGVMCSAILEIKACSNKAPYGKTFIKKFCRKINMIQKVQKRDKLTFVPSVIHDRMFKVSILDDSNPSGLEYKTIPRYLSKTVYINDEPVCRLHKFNDKESIEFSSDRKYNEIISIVDEAYNNAEKAESDYIHNVVEKHFRTKTFFD